MYLCVGWATLLILGAGGCSWNKPDPAVQLEERVLEKREQEMNLLARARVTFELERDQGKELRRASVSKIEAFLVRLVTSLAPSHPQLRVQLVTAKATSKAKGWKTEKGEDLTPAAVQVTPVLIWVQTSALKLLQYDHEVAAMLAMSLAAWEQRSYLRTLPLESSRVGQMQGSQPEKKREWRLSLETQLSLITSAMQKMYQAGYDGRGMVGFWKRLQGTFWRGEVERQIPDFEDKAYDEMSHQSPLKNPIVRTPEFVEIQGRIQEL